MRFLKKSLVLSPIIALLFASSKADVMKEEDCYKSTSCNDCVASRNSDVFDGTKCLPIYATASTSDAAFLQDNVENSYTCAPWSDVQNKGYQINYPCNAASTSSVEKDEVKKATYIQKWAFYSYDA